jgi:hypothetical protein
MQNTMQRQILNALLVALRPLARALLRAGIGYREFAEISKSAFVDIATKDYGLRGRPTNISRVAVMTGLTRKEVRRLRDKSAAGEETMAVRSTPMSMILHRWFTEDEFLDGSGKPRDLGFDGDGPNFSSLVRQYGGDIPSGAMRTELMRIDAIAEMPDGSLKVLKRNVSNLEVHDRIINGLSAQLYPAALAMEHNTRTEDSDDAWIQRSVSTSHVRQGDMGRVRRISSDRLVELTDSIDDLFAAYETLYDKDEREEPTRSVGIGVFYFEEDKAETDIFA